MTASTSATGVDCVVSDCDSSYNAQSGVKITDNCHGTTVVGNTLVGNTAAGVRVLVATVGMVIKGNTCRLTQNGVSLEGGSNDTVISGNRVSGNAQNGVKAFQAHRVSITGNTIASNGQRGVISEQSGLCATNSNVFSDNGTATPGTTHDGIYVDTNNRTVSTATRHPTRLRRAGTSVTASASRAAPTT